MGRDFNGNLNQISKHNLGGTISIPAITRTTSETVERDRLDLAKEDLRRLCVTFGADFDFLITEMMERITTGMSHAMAISWAKEQVMHRKTRLVVKDAEVTA